MKRREIDPDAKISPHFYWRAFFRSRTAARLGIRNVIYEDSEEHLDAAALFGNVVEPVRFDVDHPLFITSGYRCKELNEAVGGVPTSEHRLARAVDLASERLDAIGLAQAFERVNPPFNQLILEYDQDIVHVSHVRGGENRREVLTRFVKDGVMQYRNGLIPTEDL